MNRNNMMELIFSNSNILGHDSESISSLILEMFFWSAAYLLHCSLTPRALFKLFRSKPFFERAKQRKGVILSDARSDMVYMLTLGIHHTVAGMLMILGTKLGMPQLWRRGYLCEVGNEIADLLAMKTRMYPYHNDSIKPELRCAIAFHHIPGICLSLFVFQSGLSENPHMQGLATWLLLCAAFGAYAQFYIHSLDFTRDMVKAAAANMVNVGFYIYGRFYLFPRDSLALMGDIRDTESIYSNPAHYMLYVGGFFLFLFNLAILAEFLSKTVRYNKAAWEHINCLSSTTHMRIRGSVLSQFGR